jgi:hypothetical protein
MHSCGLPVHDQKDQTVMVVPTELVPEITRLITTKRPA